MADIDVDLVVLEQYIQEMNNLKNSWKKETIPDCACEGRTAAELLLIAQMYGDIYDSICKLAANSAGYLGSLKGAYMYADNNTSF